MDSSNQVIAINPQDAWELMQKEPKSIFIDVRSHMEYLFIGHPVGAIHIPWIDEPDWVVNPRFVIDIRQLVLGGLSHDECSSHDVPIILICRSGQRSREAGELLASEGFTTIYNIMPGFEGELNENHRRSSTGGWRHDGLPWEQC